MAASLYEWAGVLRAQGDLAGAQEKLERSLAIQVSMLGTEAHPDVAASLRSLAGVLRDQGDWAGAREKWERVLAIELKVHGTRDHYSTAMTEVDLAALLLHVGEDPKRAARLRDHAYRVFVAQLGPDHPTTRDLAKRLGR